MTPYRLASLLFALILTAYWGRVVRLVYKFRKKAGHDANFRPKEPLGLLLRTAWYPAVVAWIIHPWLITFDRDTLLPAPLHPLHINLILAWLSALIATLAFALTLVCWKRMGKSWRMGINPDEKTQLIVSGPYAYVRHPIYALSSILMLCTIAAIPSPAMLVIGAIHLTLLQWEASREEKYLVVHHGEAYQTYCQNVGRFLPRSAHPYHSARTSPSSARPIS